MSLSQCRYCGDDIFWMLTGQDRWIPIQPDSVDVEDEWFQTRDDGHFRYSKALHHEPHFPHCDARRGGTEPPDYLRVGDIRRTVPMEDAKRRENAQRREDQRRQEQKGSRRGSRRRGPKKTDQTDAELRKTVKKLRQQLHLEQQRRIAAEKRASKPAPEPTPASHGSPMKGAYNALQVIDGADPSVTRAAFKALVLLYHPDRAGQESEEKMKQLNEARTALKKAGLV